MQWVVQTIGRKVTTAMRKKIEIPVHGGGATKVTKTRQKATSSNSVPPYRGRGINGKNFYGPREGKWNFLLKKGKE